MTERSRSNSLAGKVYLIDTNVFIWAFDAAVAEQGDPRTAESRACLHALRAGNARAVLSVLSLAEAQRKTPAEPLPSFSWPIVVPVVRDDVPFIAAARWQSSERDSTPLAYLKFGATLVAQAQRLKAAAFLSYDRKAHPLAAAAGVELLSPGELLAQLRD